MLKRILVPLAVLLVAVFLLTACGGNSSSTTTTTTTSKPASTTSATTSAQATTAATTAKTTAVSTSTAPTTTAAATTKAPKSGGIFKFADPRGPSTTLGWFAEAGAQGGMWSSPTFETLMEIDMNNNFLPMLATSWKLADDLSSITLNLRKGVKFHDGSDFNAAVA